MEDKSRKKIRILYIVVIGLIFLIVGMFIYFQNKINNIQNHAETNSQMIITTAKRLRKIVELNYLDEENYTYKVNPKNWQELLKKETLLSFDDIGNYTIDKVILKDDNARGEYDLHEYTIIINIPTGSAFSDFTKLMYKKISDILVLTENDTSKVESFKEGRGYYDITSFEESTYNNMYYDYIKELSDGTVGGAKIKIKLLHLEEANQIKMEINKF